MEKFYYRHCLIVFCTSLIAVVEVVKSVKCNWNKDTVIRDQLKLGHHTVGLSLM